VPLDASTLAEAAILAIALTVAMCALWWISGDLRMLSFGEEDARSRGVDTERIDQAVSTIVKEFRTMASETVPADELRRCKNYLKGRLVLQLEDPRGLLMFGLRREVLENRLAEPEELLEAIEAVTADDIQRLAQQIIVDDGLNFALVGPFDDQQRFLDLLAA